MRPCESTLKENYNETNSKYYEGLRQGITENG